MATPNIVPRADSEGGLGTASKYWAAAYIDAITTTGNVVIGGEVSVLGEQLVLTSGNGEKPLLHLKATNNSANGPNIKFQVDRGQAPVDGDTLGSITFVGEDSTQTTTTYAAIRSDIHETTHGDESGELFLSVANNGTLQNGLFMKGDKTTAAQVDVTIGNGAASKVEIPGRLGVGANSDLVEAALTVKGDPGNNSQPNRITNSVTDPKTGLFLNSTGNAINEKYGMQFGGFNEYSIGGIFGVMDNVQGSTSGDITIDFGNGTSSGALVEKVRFTHEGQVDILGGALTISGDGSNAATLTESSAGDFTIASVDDLRLNAGGNDVVLQGASGDEFGRLTNSNQDLVIQNTTSNKDIRFQGNAGGVTITPLSFDISDSGAATFTGGVTIANNDATLTLYAAASPFTPTIEFIRNSATFGDDTSTDYRLIDTGGQFKIQSGHKPGGGSITTTDMLVLSGDANPTATLVGIPFYSDATGESMYTHDVSGTDNNAFGNTAYGFTAMDAITTGDFNTAIGKGAGTAISTGAQNTVVGKDAGKAIETGVDNVALGFSALSTNIDGDNNTAIGFKAMETFEADADGGGGNTAVGANAMRDALTGENNTAIGVLALGDGILTGDNNIGIGTNAGMLLAGANENVIIGVAAADALVTGERNVVVGRGAMGAANGSESRNTAIGWSALAAMDTDGSAYNTAVGYNAGGSIDSGVENAIMGGLAGDAITTGSYNAAFGTSALGANTKSSSNVAIGNSALASHNLTSASSGNNVAIGFNAGVLVTTGIRNTLIGAGAGDDMSLGERNVALGFAALSAVNAGSRAVAIGDGALQVQQPTLVVGSGATTNDSAVVTHAATTLTTGMRVSDSGGNIPANSFVGVISNNTTFNLTNSTGDSQHLATADASSLTLTFTGGLISNNAVGYNAGISVTTGVKNTIIGNSAGIALTSGQENTVLGYNALALEDTHGRNVAIGNDTLATLNASTEAHCTAVGYGAGFALTLGKHNTLLGSSAGDGLTTGEQNVAVGFAALGAPKAGSGNTAVGYQALTIQADASSAGSVRDNTAVGHSAGAGVTTGTNNALLGAKAGIKLTTGANSTMIGYNAGKETLAGGSNTFIGAEAGAANTGGGNNIAIGKSANFGGANFSNAIIIGAGVTQNLGSNTTEIGTTAMTKAIVHGLSQVVTTANADAAITVPGAIYNFGDADGAIITLPNSGATEGSTQIGKTYEFVVTVTATANNHKIVCADTTNEKIYGQVHMVDTDSSDASEIAFVAAAGDNFSAVTMNGTTTGIIGSRIRITNVAADIWFVEGNVHHTGNASTPFATS